MTPERLVELRALADGATEGPWIANGHEVGWEYKEIVENIDDSGPLEIEAYDVITNWVFKEDNAVFIAAARTAVPELLDEVERLQFVAVHAVLVVYNLEAGLMPCPDNLSDALETAGYDEPRRLDIINTAYGENE